MSQCVWELVSIEKSFIKERDSCDIYLNQNSNVSEYHNLNDTYVRTERVDYDYSEELSKKTIKKNEKNKLKFEKIMKNFFISDISKYVRAFVKKNDSNIRNEIGITTNIKTKSEDEQYWINSYIYNFISHCLTVYYDCKHYIVITRCNNLIQKLTGTGEGYYGIYFTNGKKIGGLENLFINIKQVKHISYSIMKTLQTRAESEKSISNNDESCSFINLI
ncbi:hypothetical protein YYG_04378 [Plasmodium vinckei petteri]|uniref:Uncharacterized protein n=1 Tax=Plasmodium vinckei petteri TaxID=138298 RepID=W7ANS2_PLAVN|nr:hypothetical protein YYG_04378 [Plasmodium vinckei petteri]CAD2111899.1 conserved Plasmodium protein, unknown function [Plasmodium vinckei petteri]